MIGVVLKANRKGIYVYKVYTLVLMDAKQQPSTSSWLSDACLQLYIIKEQFIYIHIIYKIHNMNLIYIDKIDNFPPALQPLFPYTL